MLVGSLDAPNQTFLVDCHLLDSSSKLNSSIILHTVDDISRQLEIKRENFSLFLTDTARYMPSAEDIKGIILFFDAFQLRCALTTELRYACASSF